LRISLKAPQEYLERVKKLKPRVYLGGERIADLSDHPVTRTVVEATAKVYELSSDPQ
jgi:4-hydroxybutyryl-CoA dehydratase/vinylacetyl-CoA-Delta-isomerase